MFGFLNGLKGGMLTGREIEKQIRKGAIRITPYDPSCINPNSYNLKLHPQLLIYKRDAERANVLNLNKENVTSEEQKIAYEAPSVLCIDEQDAEATENCYEIGIKGLGDSIDSLDKRISDIEHLSNIDSCSLPPLDMRSKNETIELEIPEEGFVLQPGVLYIGRTVERTWSDKFIPMINGRSSGGRLGISIHICAGFGDVGFDGTWTLEITCVEPVRIYPNSEIAQVCYFSPCGKIKNLYRGRYHGQIDATASRFYKNKEEI